jgi:hypothetical protein
VRIEDARRQHSEVRKLARSRDSTGNGSRLPQRCDFEQEHEHEQERGEAYFATAFSYH